MCKGCGLDPYGLLGELDSVATELDADWGITVKVAAETMWSCEVRLTRHPNDPHGADISTVVYVTGQGCADEALYNGLDYATDHLAQWALEATNATR